MQVEPLTAAAVRKYLLFRFPDPARSNRGQPRWRPILTRLTTPTTAGANDRREDLVVSALRSPLRLFLVVEGYRDPTSDPDELTRIRDSASLDAHLLARLIPAATRLHPRPDGSSYNPERVHTGWPPSPNTSPRRSARAGRAPTCCCTNCGGRLARAYPGT